MFIFSSFSAISNTCVMYGRIHTDVFSRSKYNRQNDILCFLQELYFFRNDPIILSMHKGSPWLACCFFVHLFDF